MRTLKKNPILDAESGEIAGPDSQDGGPFYLRNRLFGRKCFSIPVQDQQGFSRGKHQWLERLGAMNDIEIPAVGVCFQPIAPWMLLVLPSNREVFNPGNFVPLNRTVKKGRPQGPIAKILENLNELRKILAV